MAAAVAVAGCGSSDSTVFQNAGTDRARSATCATSRHVGATAARRRTDTAAADPCAVNLAAPEITKAVSELPRDPRSNQGWNPEPLAGNYNECAQLSVVIVKANTNSENPNTRAVMFHQRQVHPHRRAGYLRLQRH